MESCIRAGRPNRRRFNALVATVLGLLVLAGSSSELLAAKCSERKFEIAGRVRDASGRALSGARLYFLMDKVSKERFLKQGIRGRVSRTDVFGQYIGYLACGSSTSGFGDPCSGKPKHLTVIVDHDNYRMLLKTFKLNELTITENPGGTCTVAVPEIALKPGV